MIYSIRVLLPYFDNLENSVPSKDSPYRIIDIENTATLVDFSRAILDAFNFTEDHFYGFYDNINTPLKSNEAYLFLERMIDEIPLRKNINEYLVKDLFENNKLEWLFLFDYENEWNFHLILLDKYPYKTDIYPKITDVFGTAPSQYEDFEDYEDNY